MIRHCNRFSTDIFSDLRVLLLLLLLLLNCSLLSAPLIATGGGGGGDFAIKRQNPPGSADEVNAEIEGSMEGARGAADLEREKSCAGGGRRREEGGDEAVGSADGNVAEPRDVEDLDAEGGGEEVVVDREDEAVVPGGVGTAAVVDGGGEFVLRVDPRHRVGAEEFGDGGQVLGR
ncbi:hypothetical protein CEY00_Acc25353 [Actinidia chinensis var. chinensis]|uniref:Uncharacterized protein n=1 Tax=Actinidia chinensis var. chinensis TaxID=1590841 RepID=A0A2R6PYK9_ACTCC|nr:hypothetical protein CEY00_Acc25353 [Actinidia chinensis var. chinensis]